MGIGAALAAEGPQQIELDMLGTGPFAESLSGPPGGGGRQQGLTSCIWD